MVKMEVKIGSLTLRNPVTTASGCYGYGPEFDDFYDISRLGAVFMKGTTGSLREGNPYPRMAETPSGMLNSVGLQNKGVDHFIREIYPRIRKYNTHFIVNVNGSTLDEYIEVTEKVNELEGIPAIELNISCPNVKQGGMVFGTHCPSAIMVTEAVRKAWSKHLIVKLSPNVTSITEFARAVVDSGADSISLINTLLGMAIDAEKRVPVLGTVTGGLSGPAVKPVALRMIWQCYRAVNVPIWGMGGIMNATDAIEFMLAGSAAVQIGTANFIDPMVCMKVLEGMEEYCRRHGIAHITELTGALRMAPEP